MSPTVDATRAKMSMRNLSMDDSHHCSPPMAMTPRRNARPGLLSRVRHGQRLTTRPRSSKGSNSHLHSNDHNTRALSENSIYSNDRDSDCRISNRDHYTNGDFDQTNSDTEEQEDKADDNNYERNGDHSYVTDTSLEDKKIEGRKSIVTFSSSHADLRDQKAYGQRNPANYSLLPNTTCSGEDETCSLTVSQNGVERRSSRVREQVLLNPTSAYKDAKLVKEKHANVIFNPASAAEHDSLVSEFPSTPTRFSNQARYYTNNNNEVKENSNVVHANTSATMTATSLGNSSLSVDIISRSESGSLTPGISDTPATTTESTRRHRRTLDPDHVSHQFFHLEPCLYSHRMFQRAARIFAVLKHDDADTEEKKAMRRRNGDSNSARGKIPDMDFLDAQEQIKTFELTFATLKFQKLFSHILDYIGFFHKYTDLNDHYSLVYVILHDLQTRKFQRRSPFPNELLDTECLAVEEALLTEKTKLQANIAKERIKHNAPSVDYLLPEHVRNKDETKSRTPVYMWVNQMKTTIDNVIMNLKDDNFVQMDTGTDMSEVTSSAFLIDPHCPDVLTFPPHLSMEIKESAMVRFGHLVQQDKSSCLAPQSVTYLLGHNQDAIHVNIGTGMTTCHMASLLREQSPQSHIWAFGVNGPQKTGKVIRTMEFLEVKNIKIVHDEFLNVDPEDLRFKSVRVILISANCSKSAITSPVQFIVSEGEDTQILGELSVGEADMTHVRDLMVDHERLLKHALKFPKVQAVVYTTRSRFEAENEVVVTKVLEFLNITSNKQSQFKVAPPVLPFTSDEINTGKGGVDGRFLRFLPSDKANGCFVAIIAREPEEAKDGRFGDKNKSKSRVGKSKSAQTAGSGTNAAPRKHRKSLKGALSLPEVPGTTNGNEEEPTTPSSLSTNAVGSGSSVSGRSTLKQKLSLHKAPAAIGARLYQKGLVNKMEKSLQEKPEHMKVINHPAPFR